MLYWAAVFLIIAIIAACARIRRGRRCRGGIAKILFYIFVVIFVVSLLFGLMRRGHEPLNRGERFAGGGCRSASAAARSTPLQQE